MEQITDQEKGVPTSKEDKGPKGHSDLRRPYVLCMTGVEQQYVEKDMIKWIRKYLEVDNKPVPLHGVHKKRG